MYQRSSDKQKGTYDKKAMDHQYKVGDRVTINMPSAMTGKAWKLVRPSMDPSMYLVLPSNIEACLVEEPSVEPIFVLVNRVRPCYFALPDTSWTGR